MPQNYFFRPKNPTVSAGFEPANLGTKSQHATARRPKSYVCVCIYIYIYIYMCVNNVISIVLFLPFIIGINFYCFLCTVGNLQLNGFWFLYVLNFLYYCGLMMAQVGAETGRPLINVSVLDCWL